MSWRVGAILTQRASHLATVGLLVVAILSLYFGQAEAQAPSQAAVERTCVKAGLMRPRGLKVHFWLQKYSHQTGPLAGTEFLLRPMPKDCSAVYRRTLLVKVRYKTTLRPWRSLRSYNYNNNGGVTGVTTWVRVWNQDEGTGAKLWRELGGLESSFAPWGKVQHVEARARLWVKDRDTGKIVGRKMFPVRARFCQSPTRSRACAF